MSTHKKRVYRRKCPRCGQVYNQEDMIRTDSSETGWICEDCNMEEHPEYYIEEF